MSPGPEAAGTPGARRAPTTNGLFVALAVGAVLFAFVATLNSGGYRYGVGDQAAYIPQILRAFDRGLFPRDGALLDGQSRLFVLDEILAAAIRVTPFSLETWFIALYVVTLGLLYAGLVRLGSGLLTSRWSVATFLALETVRHRITKTAANTLEGYFHPRQLAFACGVLGVAQVVRGRPWTALGGAVLAAVVHPTTGLWFLIWIGIAVFVEHPRWRPALAAIAGLGAMAGVALLAAGFLPLARMDAAWLAPLAGKDYLFPTADWGPGEWIANLSYPLVIAATWWIRRGRGLVRPGETGLVAGVLALVAIFLLVLPFVAAHVAVAVQFQISRVFWMADLLALLYAVWWLAEGGRGVRMPADRRPAIAFAVVAVLALARGTHVLYVQHPERSLAARSLPDDAWTEASRYLRDHTPPSTHVLADPGHAWRFGTSLRVTAARDVFLENVKDEAMSMYDRRTAIRVAERQAAIGDFAARTPAELQALGRRYALDVVISERDLGLPELYRNRQFHIYRLTP